MNHILAWDPSSGVVRLEPGVTLEQLWQHVLPSGWWPPVVSGTMTTTLGGCLGSNIHGKNNFRMGPIGEHVIEFTALLPSGTKITCTPEEERRPVPGHDRRAGDAGRLHLHHPADEESRIPACSTSTPGTCRT